MFIYQTFYLNVNFDMFICMKIINEIRTPALASSGRMTKMIAFWYKQFRYIDYNYYLNQKDSSHFYEKFILWNLKHNQHVKKFKNHPLKYISNKFFFFF